MPVGSVDLMKRLRGTPSLERLSREDLVRAVYLKDKRTLPQDIKRLLDTISVIRIPVRTAEDVVEVIRVATGEIAGISLGLTADSLHYVRTRLAMMKDREVSVDWAPREDPFDGEMIPHLDGFQLDMRDMKTIEVHENQGVVRSEVGATWKQVWDACASKGWLLPLFPVLPSPSYVGDIVGGTSTLVSYVGGPDAWVKNVDYISPEGHYCESGFDTVPNCATGYDLKSIMVVMGRHLVIPISVTFGLVPMMPVQKTVRYPVEGPEVLVGALKKIAFGGSGPLRLAFGDGLGSEVALGVDGMAAEALLQGTEESVQAQRKLLDPAFPEGTDVQEVDGLAVSSEAPGRRKVSPLAEIRTHLSDLGALLGDLEAWVQGQGPDFGVVGCLFQGGTVALYPFANHPSNRGERFDRLLELLEISRRHRCRLKDNPTVHLVNPETNLEKRFGVARRIKERVDLPNVINPAGLLWIPQGR